MKLSQFMCLNTSLCLSLYVCAQYVMVVLKGSVPICFGGTQQPAAYGELISVGGIDPVTNNKISAAVATILSEKLYIPKSRFFLLFYDSKASSSFIHFYLVTVE